MKIQAKTLVLAVGLTIGLAGTASAVSVAGAGVPIATGVPSASTTVLSPD